MTSDLNYIVSIPFKRKGKDALKDTEFILSLSLDLKWFDPDEAKAVLNDAKKSGLLKSQGEMLYPLFDISKVEIPAGWKPELNAVEIKTILDKLIERIILGTGIEKRKVIAMINKKQEEFSKLVAIEVSAILVAVENGVMVDDLIDEEYRALTTVSSS